MSGFDANHVFAVSVRDQPATASTDTPSQTEKLLFDFLLQYRIGGEFVYRYVWGSPSRTRDPIRPAETNYAQIYY